MWVLVQSLTASEPNAFMACERLNIQKQKLCWGRKGCFLGFVSSVFLPPDPFIFFSKSKKISFLIKEVLRRKKKNPCYFVYSFTDLCHSLLLVFQSSASTLDSNSAWLLSYQSLFSPQEKTTFLEYNCYLRWFLLQADDKTQQPRLYGVI